MSKFSISTSTWSISVETTDDGGGTIVSRGLHGDADYYRGVGGADYEAKPYEVAIDRTRSRAFARSGCEHALRTTTARMHATRLRMKSAKSQPPLSTPLSTPLTTDVV
jgi:hypothetical protein